VPAGTPQEVVSVVNAVAQAVLQFLTNFPATVPGAASMKWPSLKLSAADRIALANIRSRSLQNEAKLKGVKK
jgi:hypothetical protein